MNTGTNLAEIVAKRVSASDCVDFVLIASIKSGASDIHIDPSPEGIRIVFRVDGVLEPYGVLPMSYHGEIISRLKVLSHLRTDVHCLPHDGRFIFLSNDIPVDARISIMPTYYGENAVIRILVRQHKRTTLLELGFSADDDALIKTASGRGSGLIISSGPTGSGKTSTLYSIVNHIASLGRKVVTLEDPIEYSIDGVRQIQINPQTGFTFARGLRSILRQDPDVIMVGEIRDAETASIAVHTALTGHLVLSTIHTAGAVEIIERLRDMGVEGYLIASTLSLTIGQRLVRTVCGVCTVSAVATREKHQTETRSSCSSCRGSGYSGRTVIAETSVIGDKARELIARGLPRDDIKRHLINEGMEPLAVAGRRLLETGRTTREELARTLDNI